MSLNRIPMQRQIVSSLSKHNPRSITHKSNIRFFASSQDANASTTKAEANKASNSSGTKSEQNKQTLTEHRKKLEQHKKTLAELDKELELKMRGIAGDGGDSGVEYEDGQPVAMKRSVKNNMFRYI